VPNSYANLHLVDVAKTLLKKRFSFLTDPLFTRKEKRFKDSIKRLPKHQDYKIKDLDCIMLIDNNLTIGDVIRLYTDPTYADSYKDALTWHIYSSFDDVYFDVNKHNSLYVPVKALYEKNWGLVENLKVYNVPICDEKGIAVPQKWYSGLQKDAPFMNAPIVKKIKEFITK
jgi:hypothetical protein